MRDVLEQLKFAVFEFVLIPTGTIKFPDFKGNVFRGALGKTLKKLTCACKDTECNDCIIRDKCIYSRIFAGIHPARESILSKVERKPHPFVLYVHHQHRNIYPEDSKIRFTLTLIGDALEYIPYFILAFEEIGRHGIGKTGTPFYIENIMSSNISIYDPETKRVSKSFPVLKGNTFYGNYNGIETLTMEMITPMRIKFNKKFQKQITFEILTRNLLRRIQLLCALYCDGPAKVEFNDLIEKAKDIHGNYHSIYWQTQNRYSFRQKKVLGMGGVSGKIEFQGHLEPFIPFLKIGEYLHIGKGTAFGLGKIQCTSPSFN